MSIVTDTLTLYQNAEAAVLKGQTFRLGDKQVTFADLQFIQKGRREWEARVAAEAAALAGRPQGVSSSLSFATVDFGCGQ